MPYPKHVASSPVPPVHLAAALDAAHEQLHRHDDDPDYVPTNADADCWYALHKEAEHKAQIFYTVRAQWQETLPMKDRADQTIPAPPPIAARVEPAPETGEQMPSITRQPALFGRLHTPTVLLRPSATSTSVPLSPCRRNSPIGP